MSRYLLGNIQPMIIVVQRIPAIYTLATYTCNLHLQLIQLCSSLDRQTIDEPEDEPETQLTNCLPNYQPQPPSRL